MRDLLSALAVSAVGALGALPGARSGADPVALLTWLAIWSLPAGFLCGARQLRLWPFVLVPPAIWMAIVVLVDASSQRDLPTPQWAALAWTALFGAGFGLGRVSERSPMRGACILFLLASLFAALPLAPGLFDPLPPPAVRARMIELSPATLLLECAGVDLLRLPTLYESAVTSDLDPQTYTPWRGRLAGPLLFLVGCAAAVAGEWFARRRKGSRFGHFDRERATDIQAE